MSVLVKSMEMPESCIDCEIKQYDDYEDNYVCPFSGVVCLSIWRQDACPLVALPDTHGRLVDADALEKILEKIPAADIKNMGGQAYVLVKLSQVFNVINNQPTIEPERKKGKWINIRHDNIAECDQCGITGRAWMNFCFDCGADMREPEDIPMEYFESGGR